MGSNERRRRSNLREICFLVGLIGVLVIAGVAFSRHVASRTLATVRFEVAGKLSTAFKLEVADSEPKRQLGLMYRKSLDANRGMIFVFPAESVQRFWMKDTYLTLDMIFVNNAMDVVGVLENVPPLTLEGRSVDAPSRYVIELRGGTAQLVGIKKGAKLRIEGEIPHS